MTLNLRGVVLKGRSGTEYPFSVWLRATRFLPKGGVYVMARTTGPDQFEMVFIGETADMSKRPINPAKTACFDQHGVDSIFSLDEPEAPRRADIVRDLLMAINPVCNRD
ncbi:MAG: hypothetical protein JNM59_05865 [Hyphomonadaceae bacterium]|nr:hypothetical protein [Hyphomonadaceae bacterium]